MAYLAAVPFLVAAPEGVLSYGEGRGWWQYPEWVSAGFDAAVGRYAPGPVRDAHQRFHLAAYHLGQRHAVR